MNASKPKDAKETKTADRPLDPFAVDFFGEKKTGQPKEEGDPGAHQQKSLNGSQKKAVQAARWFERLPHLTRGEFLFSGSLEKLPDNLTKAAAHKVSEIITRYTFQAAKSVRCQMISITEVGLAKTLAQLEKSPQTVLALGCRPDSSTALVAFDTGFASSVIDLVLSGKGESPNVPRRLSPIEKTIIEFLAGNILAGINDWVGGDLLCLQTSENEFGSLFEKNERGAEAVFRLDFSDFSGIITLLAPPDFLAAIDKTRNPLLLKKNGQKKFRSFEEAAPHLRPRIQVGATTLDSGSLAYLEPEDIVLIERPRVRLQNSEFSGSGTVSLGSGENFALSGEFLSPDLLSGADGFINFKLGEIKSFPVRRKINPERLEIEKMNNKKTDEAIIESADENSDEYAEPTAETESEEDAEETSAAAVENILVNLRVEIAGDRISLREIQRLRRGQIINLGCRPTDPVRLVTDTSDQPVAIGELVDIDGRLGVRLTRIFI